MNGALYFPADNGEHGSELWKTDGTEAGTVMVKDINPNPYRGSSLSLFVSVNGVLYFAGNDGEHGSELWKSDGTEAGTVMVKDINPNRNSAPSSLVNVNGVLYFEGDDGEHGRELWKSDGSGENTILVRDIYPGEKGSFPRDFTALNGRIYFWAVGPMTGREVWVSDGTYEGTHILHDLSDGIAGAGGSLSAVNSTLWLINERLFIRGFRPDVGVELFVHGPKPTASLITGITPPEDGGFSADQTLDFTINFTGEVEVSGTPLLSIDIGGTIRQARYLSGSGSRALVFQYVVAPEDKDEDGIAILSPVELNGGTIADTVGNNVGLEFSAPDTSGLTVGGNVDATAPTIANVNAPADGVYRAGGFLDFTVTFDESVTVSGESALPLVVGGMARAALFHSGSPGTTLIFRYEVQAGESDVDGVAADTALTLNGGSILDAVRNEARLEFTPPDTTGVLVDSKAPSITATTPPGSKTYVAGESVSFTLAFDENVVVTGTPQLPLVVGNASTAAAYVSGSESASLVFATTVQSGELDVDGIALGAGVSLNGGTIADTAGNAAVLSLAAVDTSGILVDGVAPVLSSVTPPAEALYGVGQDLDFVVHYSEEVIVETGSGRPSLSLTIGTETRAADFVSGSNSRQLVFRYTVQAGEVDNDGIAFDSTSIGLNGGTMKDAAGNDAGLAFSAPGTGGVKVDGSTVSISSMTPPNAGSYRAGQNIDFEVIFDKPVTVTGTPRLSLTIGSTARTAEFVSGSTTANLLFRYTVQASETDTDGIELASPIDLNGGTIQSSSGNDASLTFTSPDLSAVLVDTTIPALSTVTGPISASYGTGQNLDFTATFSENVRVDTTDGTPSLGVTIGSTIKTATYVSGNETAELVFRYAVANGDSDGDGIASESPISLNGGSLGDAAGNGAALSFSPPDTSGVLVDTTAPSIASVEPPANGSYKEGATLDFTVNYDEPVTVTGTPAIGLTVGSTARNASFSSGGGTSALVFRYTVQASETDTDGIADCA